ncbi:hypothetical protein LGK95_21400 [Clostridium algoriphilum]|uniref:hypothetical protein n=1 Tax=Clostridium algoriphilum TaxID=198347 RepID=UPI001CF3DABE|nr:hypothetical protein [Clostridium algoriphilum]MCB2296011.1 hypothetical protein [Clostridium algoriphilum]
MVEDDMLKKIIIGENYTLEQIKFLINDDDILICNEIVDELTNGNYRVDEIITGFVYKKRTSGFYQIGNKKTTYQLTKI